MTDIVITLTAERGNKFEETGQCISSHAGSIVFLPRDVKPGERVRVRLSQIVGKVDARGKPMFQAKRAPLVIPHRLLQALGEEARGLRKFRALPGKEGETILRVQFGALLPESIGFDWYYFGDEHVVFGSRFSPSSLVLFAAIETASESGVIELVSWLVDIAYFKRRCGGQDVSPEEIPDISEASLDALNNALQGTILAKQLA